MKQFHVMTVVGTRPEIIRLSRVITKLNESFKHTLVHTGQNYDYELNEIFFNDLEIKKPDHFLNAAGNNAAETIGKVIISIDNIFQIENPDALLVLGDTNSSLSAIAAKRRKIPIFHMEAGNRCFDMRVPEEINRRIVDHIADINLPYSDIARKYLLDEGLPPDLVIKTGSPMFEVLTHYIDKINESDVLNRLDLSTGNYFVVSMHREENVDSDKNFNKLVNSLNEVSNSYKEPIIVSTHPRTLKHIEQRNVILSPGIKLIKPLGFTDYVKLQKESKAVLSDSGTIYEEASILNFPALNLREAHERPEAMEQAPVIMTGLESSRILQGLDVLNKHISSNERSFLKVSDYSMPNVSDKIVRIILSYTDYVRKVVWKQY